MMLPLLAHVLMLEPITSKVNENPNDAYRKTGIKRTDGTLKTDGELKKFNQVTSLSSN